MDLAKPISCKRITEILMDCLFDEEDLDLEGEPKHSIEKVFVESINIKFCLKVDKLREHGNEIKEMLSHLPDEFKADKGGGWTFTNMLTLKDGSQWGEPKNANELIALGLGTGNISYLFERDMWKDLPGRVPYILINI